MTKPDVLMVGPYPDWEMPPLERDYVVHKLWLAEGRAGFLSEVGPRIRAIATNGVLGANAELIDACPSLEIIACFGVGFDAIDLDRARARGARVTNTPNVLTEDVADMAFALILASFRRIVEGEAFVRSGAWTKGALPLGRSLNGKTLGVLGYGRIGRAIARRAPVFGMSVAYCDLANDPEGPHAYHADPVSLARASDILVAATAGGAGTRNLVNAAVFDRRGCSSTSRAARWSTSRRSSPRSRKSASEQPRSTCSGTNRTSMRASSASRTSSFSRITQAGRSRGARPWANSCVTILPPILQADRCPRRWSEPFGCLMVELEGGPAPMDDRAIVEEILDAFGIGRQIARLTA